MFQQCLPSAFQCQSDKPLMPTNLSSLYKPNRLFWKTFCFVQNESFNELHTLFPSEHTFATSKSSLPSFLTQGIFSLKDNVLRDCFMKDVS